jgi:hypothetical protein
MNTFSLFTKKAEKIYTPLPPSGSLFPKRKILSIVGYVHPRKFLVSGVTLAERPSVGGQGR